MKKRFLSVLLLVPLVLLSSCGDEFGVKRLQGDIYVYFPEKKPVRLEIQTTAVSYTLSDAKFWNELNWTAETYSEMKANYPEAAFFLKVKDFQNIAGKTYGGGEVKSRKNYSAVITLTFTDVEGNTEKSDGTVYIPYLEEGLELFVETTIPTQTYGDIPVLFNYYFYRSI